MKESVELFGQDSPATVLKPDLSSGIDPDDYFSSIPYGKLILKMIAKFFFLLIVSRRKGIQFTLSY